MVSPWSSQIDTNYTKLILELFLPNIFQKGFSFIKKARAEALLVLPARLAR
jgi:hypothetical protein